MAGPTSWWSRGVGDDVRINNHGRRAEEFYRIVMRMNKTVGDNFHITKPISLKL